MSAQKKLSLQKSTLRVLNPSTLSYARGGLIDGSTTCNLEVTRGGSGSGGGSGS
jgi:hypothetical protein